MKKAKHFLATYGVSISMWVATIGFFGLENYWAAFLSFCIGVIFMNINLKDQTIEEIEQDRDKWHRMYIKEKHGIDL